MNCHLSTNSLVDAIGNPSCYIKKNPSYETGSNWTDNLRFRYLSTLMRFFHDLFMFHRRYSNCRPQNSARCNRIICQTVEKTSFLERLPCILHAFAKGYQVTNPISGFTFLSTAKSSKFRIKNPLFVFAQWNTPKENENLKIYSKKHILRKPRQTVAIV